jgi:hypothetical protein
MIKILLGVMFLFLLCCQDKDPVYKIPDFKSNSSMNEVWEPIQNIVSKNDISIVCSTGGGGGLVQPRKFFHKAFCLKGDIWEKDEIKLGIIEVDTIFSNVDADFVSKEILLSKRCRKEESEKFLQELLELGLFELPEEEALLQRCDNGMHNGKSRITDAGGVTFYIIQGNKVRRLYYYAPDFQMEQCPNIKEWSKIVKIRQLFEKDWYVKKHY